jgi:hypothetical protein
MSEPSAEDAQALLTLGSNVKSLRDQFRSYLGQGATVRDYKNAIDQAAAMAQQSRGSKVAEKAYEDVERILREDAYAAFPKYGELAGRTEKFLSNFERETGLVYGKETNAVEDFTSATSQKRGREFFKKAADESPANTTDSNELALRSEYGQEGVAGMRAAKESASTKYGEREAIELSKLSGGRGFVQPAAMAALHPTGYMAAHAAINSGFALPRLVQPLRSRLATMLPDQEALELSVPLLLQGTTQFDKARERIAKTSQQLVDAARGHSAQSR